MFPVSENDVLKKITRYEISRGVFTFEITVSHILKGSRAGWYDADINFEGRDLSPAFWGHGKSEQEALRKCLQTIEHLSPQQLLERE